MVSFAALHTQCCVPTHAGGCWDGSLSHMKMLWITLLTLLVPDQDFALALPFRVPDLATVSNAGPWAEEQVFSEVCGTLEMSCTVVPVRRRQGRCQNDGVY